MPDLSPSLNYDAIPPVDEKAPIHISVDPDKPPGVRIVDFKPSPSKQREIDAYVARDKEPEPHRSDIVVEPNATFISREKMDERLESRRVKILEIARRIYKEKKSLILEWDRANNVHKNMTTNEKDNPSNKEQTRALKILDRGHPMTKKRAIELAKKQVHQELRSQMRDRM